MTDGPAEQRAIPLLAIPEQAPLQPDYFLLRNAHNFVVAFKTPERPGHPPVAIVHIERPICHAVGGRPDKAPGKSLSSPNALPPNRVYRVHGSSWLTALRQTHELHHGTSSAFELFQHFVFAFPNQPMECIARDLHYEPYFGSLLNAQRCLAARVDRRRTNAATLPRRSPHPRPAARAELLVYPRHNPPPKRVPRLGLPHSGSSLHR